MRLLFAALVILAHAYGFHSPPLRDPLGAYTGNVINFGSLAVGGFFVISGYLISGSFQNSRGLTDYFAKRVLRIYPGFLVAFLASVLVLPWLIGGVIGTGVSALSLIGRALTLHQPATAPKIGNLPLNGSMWTIFPEFTAYVMLAVFGVYGGFRRRWPVVVVIVIVLAIHGVTRLLPSMKLLPVNRLAEGRSTPPELVLYFLLGMAAYFWRGSIRFGAASVFFAILLALLSFLHVAMLVLIFPIAFAFIVLAAGNRSTPGIRRAARFGDFSYGLYLYAFPVQTWLLATRPPHAPPITALIVLVITMPLAMASWFLVERPTLRWKARHVATTSPHTSQITN